MDEAQFNRLVDRTRQLAAEYERVKDTDRHAETIDTLEQWLAIDRTIIAASPHNLANLTVTLYRLGQACAKAGLPFARIRYTAEGVMVAARADDEELPPRVRLDTLVGEFIACAMSIDQPYGSWQRHGDARRVREAMTPHEFALLPEAMAWSLEVGRLCEAEAAPNWARTAYDAVMVMGESVYDSGVRYTSPLCEVSLIVAAIKAAERMRPDAKQVAGRALGMAHNACVDGGAEEWRLLATTLEQCLPVLRTLDLAEAAALANDAHAVAVELEHRADAETRRAHEDLVLHSTRRLLDLLD